MMLTDNQVEELQLELRRDGIFITNNEAPLAVERLAQLLLLISKPLPLPPLSSFRDHDKEAVPSPEPD